MHSLLVLHDRDREETRTLKGHLRSLAWDHATRSLFIVGNRGRVLRISGSELLELESPTKQNLRSVSVNSVDGTVLIVGNEGTVLVFREKRSFEKIESSTSENLRCVSWNSKGTAALIVGNGGTLLTLSGKSIETIQNGRANLRRIAWHPNSEEALITSNCFAEEFIPSPNLFSYGFEAKSLTPINEGRADLIGLDWKPSGDAALVVGYDVVWHNGFIANFDGSALQSIDFESKRVYPVAVAWDPTGSVAAIATATTEPGMSEGRLCLWDGATLKTIYANRTVYFSALAWNRETKVLAGLASSETRTFNC